MDAFGKLVRSMVEEHPTSELMDEMFQVSNVCLLTLVNLQYAASIVAQSFQPIFDWLIYS